MSEESRDHKREQRLVRVAVGGRVVCLFFVASSLPSLGPCRGGGVRLCGPCCVRVFLRWAEYVAVISSRLEFVGLLAAASMWPFSPLLLLPKPGTVLHTRALAVVRFSVSACLVVSFALSFI